MSATGYLVAHIPPGDERDELLGLVRIGLKFKAQQVGRRPGFLVNYLAEVARRIGAPLTFARLLDELELEAARRDLYGEAASPVEKVDRVWQLVTYHDPKGGRIQATFKTVKNKLTDIKRLGPVSPK